MKNKIKNKLILNNGTETITSKSLKELKLSSEEAYQILKDFHPCDKCKFVSFTKGYRKCVCQYNTKKEFYEALKDKNGFIQGSIYI